MVITNPITVIHQAAPHERLPADIGTPWRASWPRKYCQIWAGFYPSVGHLYAYQKISPVNTT